MAINAGDADCTTGLSKRAYDYLIADTRAGFASPLNAAGANAVKALCWAMARAFRDELQANGEAVVSTSLGGLQSGTLPPATEKTIPLR